MNGDGATGDEPMTVTREYCAARDAADPFGPLRDRFLLQPHIIYLDGNSLGALPRGVAERVDSTIRQEWGESLIGAWNAHGWFQLPLKLGNRLARLIGAEPDSVIVADTISVNLFKLLTSALGARRERRVVLSDSGNFPSDLYVAQALTDFLGHGYELRIVAPEAVMDAITDDVAVAMITEVDYRTARRHDMLRVTARAHEKGALISWDLAHSAGAVPVDLKGAGADFAVGCTYKYLNGGPGSPAFLYVRPDLQNDIVPALAGWWGHARPFSFEMRYEPAPGIIRQQCGTQSILAMAALDTALDAFDRVDMTALHGKAKELCQLFIDEVEAHCGRFGVKLAGPRDMDARGTHVSFQCPEGYAVMQALIARGVIGDFRAPDLIRFGFTPLYTSFMDAFGAAAMLHQVLEEGLWNRPEFLARRAVT
jgi:kynureninase